MLRISVCLDTILTEYSFIERVKRVKNLGIDVVEFWFHDEDKDIDDFIDLCQKEKIEVSAFVVNSSDGGIGGSLVNPEDERKYLSRLEKLIPFAHKLNCKRLITCSGNLVQGKPIEKQTDNMKAILEKASRIVEREGITLVLEALNSLVDHEGYFLDSATKGAEIVRDINHPNVKLLYDIYHMQIMEGNITSFIEKNIDIIGHFHSAGVPGRHEPYIGELNYKYIVERIGSLDYEGYFGLEYFPTISSIDSLRRVKEYLLEGME